MKIVKPQVIIPEVELDPSKEYRIEQYGRVCYKSEDNQTEGTNLLRALIERGHESVIEHEKVTVKFITDRGVSHELVRHRIASYSQESTRYCNYSREKFGEEITVILPDFFVKPLRKHDFQIWQKACQEAEDFYFELLELGATPQEARTVLPNSLKTEIVATMNMREWRHFFKLRCSNRAHPQIRQIAIPTFFVFKKYFPNIFSDLEVKDYKTLELAEVIIKGEDLYESLYRQSAENC